MTNRPTPFSKPFHSPIDTEVFDNPIITNAGNFLLREDGSRFLREDGSFILRES